LEEDLGDGLHSFFTKRCSKHDLAVCVSIDCALCLSRAHTCRHRWVLGVQSSLDSHTCYPVPITHQHSPRTLSNSRTYLYRRLATPRAGVRCRAIPPHDDELFPLRSDRRCCIATLRDRVGMLKNTWVLFCDTASVVRREALLWLSCCTSWLIFVTPNSETDPRVTTRIATR
jgi:hypothetical protein